MVDLTLSQDGTTLTFNTNGLNVAFDGSRLIVTGGPFNITNLSDVQNANAILLGKISAATTDANKVISDLK